MRFLFFGVGAIGTYIGGSLVLSGQEVVFLERPEVAELIKQKGIKLNLGGKDYQVEKPDIVTDIQEALKKGPYQAAVQAVKSYDTTGLLESLAPYKQDMPPVICLQNGVENEIKMREILGPDRVIAGTVTTAIGRKDTGYIVLEKLRGMGIADEIGQYGDILEAFKKANLKAERYPNAAGMKWSKMLTNLIANASSAILQMTPGEIFNHPGLFKLEIEMMRETLAVMNANHIRVTNLPGTPVKALAWAVKYLPLFISQPVMTKQVAGGRGAKMPSFYLDLTAGRGLSEVDYLNGAVVRFGEKSGIATPVNKKLTEILMGLTTGKIPQDTYRHNPAALLKEIYTNQ